jgi:hypothetical protein
MCALVVKLCHMGDSPTDVNEYFKTTSKIDIRVSTFSQINETFDYLI